MRKNKTKKSDKFKKIWFLPVILAILIVAGAIYFFAVNPKAEKTIPQGMQTYQDEKYGFSFQYPANVTVSQEESALGAYSGGYHININNPDGSLSAAVLVEENLKNQDLDQVGYSAVAKYGLAVEGGMAVSDILVDNNKAKQYTPSNSETPYNLVNKMIVILKNGLVFEIIGSDKNSDIFETVKNSFRF